MNQKDKLARLAMTLLSIKNNSAFTTDGEIAPALASYVTTQTTEALSVLSPDDYNNTEQQARIDRDLAIIARDEKEWKPDQSQASDEAMMTKVNADVNAADAQQASNSKE